MKKKQDKAKQYREKQILGPVGFPINQVKQKPQELSWLERIRMESVEDRVLPQ